MTDSGQQPTLDIAAEAEASEGTPGEQLTLSPTQRAGMQLALAVGALITVVTVAILVDWVVLNAAAPSYLLESTAPEDVTTATTQIETLTTLREAEQNRSARMFEIFVGSSLLPIFTAILGYIFGTRQAG